MTCVLCVTDRRRAETKDKCYFVSRCDLPRTFKPARKWRIHREKHLQSLDPRLPNKRNLVRSIYQIINQMVLLTDIIQGKSKLFM